MKLKKGRRYSVHGEGVLDLKGELVAEVLGEVGDLGELHHYLRRAELKSKT